MYQDPGPGFNFVFINPHTIENVQIYEFKKNFLMNNKKKVWKIKKESRLYNSYTWQMRGFTSSLLIQ